jgi:hypothetical protein
VLGAAESLALIFESEGACEGIVLGEATGEREVDGCSVGLVGAFDGATEGTPEGTSEGTPKERR